MMVKTVTLYFAAPHNPARLITFERPATQQPSDPAHPELHTKNFLSIMTGTIHDGLFFGLSFMVVFCRSDGDQS